MEARPWWHMPLIPTLGRQRQANSSSRSAWSTRVRSRTGLIATVKSCLEKKKTKLVTQKSVSCSFTNCTSRTLKKKPSTSALNLNYVYLQGHKSSGGTCMLPLSSSLGQSYSDTQSNVPWVAVCCLGTGPHLLSKSIHD